VEKEGKQEGRARNKWQRNLSRKSILKFRLKSYGQLREGGVEDEK
jgi:hypothetical protein